MDTPVLEFERPIVELEQKIAEFKQVGASAADFAEELGKLESRVKTLRRETFASLTRWQMVQLSRHPARPYTLDYIEHMFEDFQELHGDRLFGDDQAIIAGFAYFDRKPVAIIGHQKGRNTKENMERNFGMARPEGYRKAKRIFELAGRFNIPVITFIDTPGAYPGIDAEERGQAEAIAKNLEIMSQLPVPLISVIIGEGGSGGALALGVTDRILMLEYSTYSVISPEGCASILWKDPTKNTTAADVLKLTSRDIFELGVIDEVIDEPEGAAHRAPDTMAKQLSLVLRRQLNSLSELSTEELLEERYQKFKKMGIFTTAS